MRRVVTAVVSAATALVVALPAAWALITPERMLSLKASQILPSSNDTYLAYTSNSLAHPNRFNVYAYRYADGNKQRINAAGTHGFSGNFDPGTNTLIYQQDRTDRVDIYTYNLDTNARKRLAVIDTGLWNFDPRISTSFISFLRYFKASGRWWVQLRLFDRVTGRFRKLMTQRATGSHWINNGTVGDRFASWNVCSGRPLNVRGCTVYVYDVQAQVLRKIPTNNGRPQYAAAVDETNDLVVFARAGFGCGRGVTFFQVPVSHLGAAPTRVASLPRGTDIDFTASISLNAETNAFDYFFERFVCGKHGSAEIYALRGISPGPT
jgi:hypothetical protein